MNERTDMKTWNLLLIILLSVVFQSCNTTEPPPLVGSIKITEIDVAVIEAYLNIQIENPSNNREVVIERNGEKVISFTASKTDTAITDTGLTENSLYKYKARLIEKGKLVSESSEIGITTMQPTSHEFTWQTFTFGEHSSSSLYDVAMIDENNIWAVGEIYTKDSYTYDSLGNWIDPYNAVHWDGNKWELKRIYYQYNGQNLWSPIRAVFAFNKNDIWFGIGSIIHWNGSEFISMSTSTAFQSAINKIWGTSRNNLYIVGNNGSIAHYNGSSWQRIESETDWDIYDVFGYTNSITSQEEIICASTNPNNYANCTILKITDKTKVERINLTTQRLTGSAWTNKGFPIYTTGDGIFTNKNGSWEEIKLPVNYVTSKIRGNGLNDIFLCGVLGLVAHYNGKDWKVYSNVYNAVYTTVNLKGSVSAFVGWRDNKAVITFGKRN